ncbi:elongation factor P 5-aminopentanone reductase [Lapidilactobacillus achengensis]|uniref:Elongation factor P 5-aminopentanone reductase n=1 Tax=Lapidilactobacillus achengensis TaxID=2486000 RepID=A0ABW1US78_9LACO|nr:SDR family oxidoreductase [Lapidilactobacillus achengensis]
MADTAYKGRAVVFGASGNIGGAICRQLAAAGWSVTMQAFKHQDVVLGLIKELSRAYPQQDFQSFICDLTRPVAPDFWQTRGDFQALVFAQGTTDYQLFSSLSRDQIQRMFQLHLLTPMQLIQQAEAKLLQQEHGRIVFVGSIYGGVGSAMEVSYSTVKGAQSSFANAYAREVAGSGLTVNVVAPGAVATAMNADFSDQELADLRQEIPLGRLAQPEEIALWVTNLVAPQADYLTGQTLYVDGGWLR